MTTPFDAKLEGTWAGDVTGKVTCSPNTPSFGFDDITFVVRRVKGVIQDGVLKSEDGDVGLVLLGWKPGLATRFTYDIIINLDGARPQAIKRVSFNAGTTTQVADLVDTRELGTTTVVRDSDRVRAEAAATTATTANNAAQLAATRAEAVLGQLPDPDDFKTAFRHDQTFASTVWDVAHNLGYEPGGFVVHGSDGNTYEPDVEYMDNDTVRLFLPRSVSGIAYIS